MKQENAVKNVNEQPRKRLIPLTKWNEHHLWPSRAGLRHLAKHAKKKGCAHAFIKAGGRCLIDEDALLEWICSYRGK